MKLLTAIFTLLYMQAFYVGLGLYLVAMKIRNLFGYPSYHLPSRWTAVVGAVLEVGLVLDIALYILLG